MTTASRSARVQDTLWKCLWILAVLGALCVFSFRVSGAEGATAPTSAPAAGTAEAAWAEVEKLQSAIHPRPEWQGREPTADELAAFQAKARAGALELARQGRAFAERFPTNENAGDARFFAVLALCTAVAAGDGASEEELKRYVAATLADPSIPEEDRVGVLLGSGNLPTMKKLGLKQFTAPPGTFAAEREEGTLASAREVIRQFPKNNTGYSLLLAIAERAKGAQQKELAREILSLDGASPAVKTFARHVLNGTKPYKIGQPLNIRFTALDGRQVDLAKLKGKVVLIDFWSTECGPCMAELPTLKTVYEKCHTNGFEIIGISLDTKESALRRVVRQNDIPWPQHFDGKGWDNEFGMRYGIFAIPTAWLVDRRGNLRFTEAVFSPEGQVASLLAEKP